MLRPSSGELDSRRSNATRCRQRFAPPRSSASSARRARPPWCATWNEAALAPEPGPVQAVHERMARTELPQQWKEWVAHNVARGCSVADIFNTLVKEGFAPEAAERELNIRRVALKRLPSDRLELYTAERFLEPGECEELIDIIKQRLRPSTISHDGSADNSFRTSRTCDLVGGESAVRALDARVCGAMGIEPAMAEPSQGQFYEVGQEFKPHTDYFETYEIERHSTPTLGQRTWTFMIYLNDA